MQELDIFSLSLILAGLSLVLYGLSGMSKNAFVFLGPFLKHGLYHLGALPFKGFFVGLFFSFFLLSVPFLSFLLSFVNAGLVSFMQSLPVILGANVGTTFFMYLLAYPIAGLFYLFISAGFLLESFAKKEKIKSLGAFLFSLGLAFLGMSFMMDGAKSFTFLDLISDFSSFVNSLGLIGLWGVIFLSAGLTFILKRSAAMLSLLFALLSVGIFEEFSITFAIILGAHIGPCFLPIINARGSDEETLKSARSHLLFNILGAFFALAIFDFYESLMLKLDLSFAIKAAILNTLVQSANALLCMIFISFLKFKAPSSRRNRKTALDQNFLLTPERAIVAVLDELKTMAYVARNIFHKSMKGYFEYDAKNYYYVKKEEDVLDTLKFRILDFIQELAFKDISSRQSILLQYLSTVAIDLERMGDHSDKLVEIAKEKSMKGVGFSEEAKMDLMELYKRVDETFQYILDSLSQIEEKDFSSKANMILDSRNAFMQLRLQVREKYQKRMLRQEESVLSAIFFNRYLETFTKLMKHSKTIAVVEKEPFFFVKTRKLQDRCDGKAKLLRTRSQKVKYDKDFFKR